MKEELAAGFRTAGLRLLQSLYTKDHYIFEDFSHHTNDKRTVVHYRQAQAIITAVRDEVDRNWFYDTRALTAADAFNDFMDMAKYLLDEGYDTPAAVLAGCTLEGHLRSLAPKHGVDILFTSGPQTGEARSADAMNQDLYKASAYSKQDNKNINRMARDEEQRGSRSP